VGHRRAISRRRGRLQAPVTSPAAAAAAVAAHDRRYAAAVEPGGAPHIRPDSEQRLVWRQAHHTRQPGVPRLQADTGAAAGDRMLPRRGAARASGPLRDGRKSSICPDRRSRSCAAPQDGLTPLHVAVATGNAALVREILKHGGAFEATDNNGNTCMHSACEQVSCTALRPRSDGTHGCTPDCTPRCRARRAGGVQGSPTMHPELESAHQACAQAWVQHSVMHQLRRSHSGDGLSLTHRRWRPHLPRRAAPRW
jgi:hypothetical protein